MAIEVRTELEKRLGVEVIDAAYPPGDARRYGALNDGKTDNGGAFAAAKLVSDELQRS
jgi:hypothetical protein